MRWNAPASISTFCKMKVNGRGLFLSAPSKATIASNNFRSEEHTSELQSQSNLVCRLLLEKKKHQPARPAIPRYRGPCALLSSIGGRSNGQKRCRRPSTCAVISRRPCRNEDATSTCLFGASH